MEEYTKTVSDDPKFNELFAQRVAAEKDRQKSKLKNKVIIFSIVALFYAYFLSTHSEVVNSLLFPKTASGSSATNRGWWPIIVLIIGMVFIWMPSSALSVVGSQTGTHGINKSVSAEGLRLFGWLIYILPILFIGIYLLGK